MTDATLHTGRFLILRTRDGWEFVERTSGPQVVALIATTDDGKLLLTDQYRKPLEERVIELPAGLVGDEPGFANETLEQAAIRELEEETGYRAGRAERLMMGPQSAGLSTEMIFFIRATQLAKVSEGGGDDTENIVPLAVPINELDDCLKKKAHEGWLIDPKIYAAMYWLSREGQ